MRIFRSYVYIYLIHACEQRMREIYALFPTKAFTQLSSVWIRLSHFEISKLHAAWEFLISRGDWDFVSAIPLILRALWRFFESLVATFASINLNYSIRHTHNICPMRNDRQREIFARLYRIAALSIHSKKIYVIFRILVFLAINSSYIHTSLFQTITKVRQSCIVRGRTYAFALLYGNVLTGV